MFVQSLGPARYEEQLALRKGLPAAVSAFISEFHSGLTADLRSDERFAYRLLLLPMKGPKTEADMALNFVRQADLSEDDLKALLGKEGSVIVAEKFQEAVHKDEMLPKAAAAAVEERIPFKFGTNEFTRLRKRWKIGPVKSGSKEQLPKSDGFSLYSPAFGQFVYRPALVDRMVGTLRTAEQYRTELGKDAVPKQIASKP